MRLFASLSPLFAGATAVVLFADATAAGIDPSMTTLVGNIGTVAVLVWYVVYDVRVRTPKMLEAFAKEQAEIREAFDTEQASTRAAHLQIVDSIRHTFAAEQATARQVFAAEQAAQRETYHREMGEIRNMLFETMKAMRVAVHDVRDTAQTLMGEDKGKR